MMAILRTISQCMTAQQKVRAREIVLQRRKQREERKTNMLTSMNSGARTRERILRIQKERDARNRGKRPRIVAPIRVHIAHAVVPLFDSRITCITPTGDRPLAFALCQQWMLHQTVKPDQWIVVDDGKVPLEPMMPMQYVRRKPQPSDPRHTLLMNMRVALPLITGDKIIIIEDDEYYAPTYVEELARLLGQYEAAGIVRSKYYYIPSGGYHRHGNTSQASFAQTSFRRSFLPEFERLLEGDAYLDIRAWRVIGRRGYLFSDDKNPLYLGIKGLPGRVGIGTGHRKEMYGKFDTSDRAILKGWVPNDYQIYLDILNGKLTNKNYRSYFPTPLPVTGITVCWNTKDLIERAYNSIRKFYPDMPIIIIDGSDPGDPCAAYVRGLVSDRTTVISLGYNIGHGRGMCMGIDKAKTPYALMFDSDTELLKPCIPEMLAMMEEDTFGVGDVDEKADFNRFVCGEYGHVNGWVRYLQPYFQLIDIRNYRKFYPYVHHGAPCYLTMLDIHQRGLSGKILKQFPGLSRSIHEFARHGFGGTGNHHIVGPWVENKGLV